MSPATFMRTTRPRARRPHRCGSCNGPILPGEVYLRHSGRSDLRDDLCTFKECAKCAERYGREVSR